MKTPRRIAIAVVFCLAASTTTVDAAEIYSQAGTEGIGVGGGVPIGTMANVRAEFNGIALAHCFSAGGLSYDGKVTLADGGLYADFFPAPSLMSLRLTAGVLVGSDYVSADASAIDGIFTLNGMPVAGDDEKIHARVKFPTIRPYVGIGLGHSPAASVGFGFFGDVGVAFGRPRVDFDVPAQVLAEAPADVAAEKQIVVDKANRLRFYPIIKVGVRYVF